MRATNLIDAVATACVAIEPNSSSCGGGSTASSLRGQLGLEPGRVENCVDRVAIGLRRPIALGDLIATREELPLGAGKSRPIDGPAPHGVSRVNDVGFVPNGVQEGG